VVTQFFLLHISFSWVELRLHTKFQLPMLLRSSSLWLETRQPKNKVSMKLIATLAPARAEIEAGVVAKADQYTVLLAQDRSY
jgi:hypothetical protein